MQSWNVGLTYLPPAVQGSHVPPAGRCPQHAPTWLICPAAAVAVAVGQPPARLKPQTRALAQDAPARQECVKSNPSRSGCSGDALMAAVSARAPARTAAVPLYSDPGCACSRDTAGRTQRTPGDDPFGCGCTGPTGARRRPRVPGLSSCCRRRTNTYRPHHPDHTARRGGFAVSTV